MSIKDAALRLILTTLLLIAWVPAAARAQSKPAGITSDVGFDQNLGADLPLARSFRDEAGTHIRLGDLFGKRPVLLVPVYYGCPLLCGQLLAGLTRSLKPLALDAGKDFDVVAFSINPEEQPVLASTARDACLQRYDRPGTESGWHFLTGDQASISDLAGAIGFRYTYNRATKLYAHAAGIVVVTPEGRVARYYYGIDFPARELEYDLKRAAAGRVGTPIGRLLLLCYDYDAATGKYTLSIVRLTRVLGTATALALAGFVLFMLRREAHERRASRSSADSVIERDSSDHDSFVG
jgi:protein SCO1/2